MINYLISIQLKPIENWNKSTWNCSIKSTKMLNKSKKKEQTEISSDVTELMVFFDWN